MIFSAPVGQRIWLALAQEETPGAVPANCRLARDRAAAARAESVARLALRLAPEAGSASRAHTDGIGAALVAPATVRLGVDLVRSDRVRWRHSAGILRRQEWDAVAPYGPACHALGWALKEAAAKASGNPLRYFPEGLVIEAVPGGLAVRLLGMPTRPLATGWLGFGDLVCAWVLPAAPSHTATVWSGRSSPGYPRYRQ